MATVNGMINNAALCGRRHNLSLLRSSSSSLTPINNRLSLLPLSFSFPTLYLSFQPNLLPFFRCRAILMSDNDSDSDVVPMPIVLIDQDSDPDSTVVQLSFGDRLGALIDTMRALKELGLDVSKGTVTTEGSVKQTKLFITQLGTGRKVEDPDMLENIRLTIIQNLLKYHPESSERLAMGEAFGVKAPEKKPDVGVATHINVHEDGPKRSLLFIETADRPGLLMEVVQFIADINIDVESAEIETVGLVAKDKFHVSYRGAALNSSLSQALINSLRHHLTRPEADDDSY